MWTFATGCSVAQGTEKPQWSQAIWAELTRPSLAWAFCREICGLHLNSLHSPELVCQYVALWCVSSDWLLQRQRKCYSSLKYLLLSALCFFMKCSISQSALLPLICDVPGLSGFLCCCTGSWMGTVVRGLWANTTTPRDHSVTRSSADPGEAVPHAACPELWWVLSQTKQYGTLILCNPSPNPCMKTSLVFIQHLQCSKNTVQFLLSFRGVTFEWQPARRAFWLQQRKHSTGDLHCQLHLQGSVLSLLLQPKLKNNDQRAFRVWNTFLSTFQTNWGFSWLI